MKVSVLYTMLPKALQERVLGECAANWGQTLETKAGELLAKVKPDQEHRESSP